MKYFKDQETGAVHAFEDDGSQDSFITENLSPMSEEEVYDHLNPPVQSLSKKEVDDLRISAYSNPYSGSDRFFAEYVRHQCLGNAEKADSAKASGLARVKEIQKQYPWPK